MLWKCCTQYASKFGKLSSGHRTAKGQFSFQSQKDNAKCSNYYTIALISHASKVMLTILQTRLNNTWTVNFQIFNLVLEKAEESEIKLPTSVGSLKKKEFQKNIYFCFIDYAKAFDCVDHKKLWKFQEMGIQDHLTCFLRNIYAGQEATVRTGHGTTDWFQIGKGVHQGYCHPVYLTYMQSTSWEMLD